MYQVILLVHVFAAVCIIALVLVQQGKGASVGAAFGSGASQTVFGSRGSGSFLFRLTIGLAAAFFITSIGLNYLASHAFKQERVITLPAQPQIPVGKQLPTTEQAPAKSTMPALPSEIPTRKNK